MRILRLSTSDDLRPEVPEFERIYRLVEQAFAAETGEPVETLIRVIWPTRALPDIIGRWLESYDPDVVFFRVSSYWFTYESVPLKFERSRFGRPAKALARAGFASSSTPWLAYTPVYRGARNVARRIVGSAVNFTAEEVIETVEACLRRIVRHERAVVVVRGALIAETGGCSAAVQRRAEANRRNVDAAVASLCASLHVHYTGCRKAPPFSAVEPYRGPDGMHINALGHRRVAAEEATALVAAWRQAHGAETPLYLESQAIT